MVIFMNQDKIYEPIRRKIEEWIRYDTYKPGGIYYDNVKAHDEYRRWHDRDCVLAGGDLKADTMFSLWLPLRHTIARINDAKTIREVGNLSGKYDFLRDLNKGNNLEKLLPKHMSITAKISTLFELGMGRENIFILPDRQLNMLRGRGPYWDYIPAFLLASFPNGEFAHYWSSPKEHLEWIEREHFQVFFDGDITPENIKDLSGAGDIKKSLPPKGIEAMEQMLDCYIGILQERRKYFTEEELSRAAQMDKMLRMDGRIREFGSRAMRGDEEALAQIEDVMNI
ncbi:MAG: hypothetical protein NC419_06560 [Muribaculaceae bacterium]|nr:hypothetical protein [Muribaculaceae bacterium]